MDPYGILHVIYTLVSTILNTAFGLPIIGWLLQTIFYIGCIWAIYRYTPAPVARVFKEKVLPHTAFVTRALRKFLIWVLADPEWLSQSGTRSPQPANNSVHTKRTFKANVYLRARWLCYGMIVLYGAQHYDTIFSLAKKLAQ